MKRFRTPRGKKFFHAVSKSAGSYFCSECGSTFDYAGGAFACEGCLRETSSVLIFVDHDATLHSMYMPEDWHGG